jgi:hypothetical protein
VEQGSRFAPHLTLTPSKNFMAAPFGLRSFFVCRAHPLHGPTSLYHPSWNEKTIKTAFNACTSSTSSYQISMLKHPPAPEVQHYGAAVRAGQQEQRTALRQQA